MLSLDLSLSISLTWEASPLQHNVLLYGGMQNLAGGNNTAASNLYIEPCTMMYGPGACTSTCPHHRLCLSILASLKRVKDKSES